MSIIYLVLCCSGQLLIIVPLWFSATQVFWFWSLVFLDLFFFWSRLWSHLVISQLPVEMRFVKAFCSFLLPWVCLSVLCSPLSLFTPRGGSNGVLTFTVRPPFFRWMESPFVFLLVILASPVSFSGHLSLKTRSPSLVVPWTMIYKTCYGCILVWTMISWWSCDNVNTMSSIPKMEEPYII